MNEAVEPRGNVLLEVAGLSAFYGTAQALEDVTFSMGTESIAINDQNWRAYSNRAYAYYLKKMFDEADADLDVALSLNPSAKQMPQIRGMMNERRLRGRVTVEEHQ